MQISEEFELDYKGKWTDNYKQGKLAPSFRNELYSVTAVYTNSRYIYTKLCQKVQNRVHAIDPSHLESKHTGKKPLEIGYIF